MKHILKLILIFLIGNGVSLFSQTILKRSYIEQQESDPIVKFALDIEISNNKLYAIYNKENKVTSYQIGGNFKFDSLFGRKGRGPGDLNGPSHLASFEDIIIVRDMENFSFFTKDGKFIKKFRTYSPQVPFAVANKTIYITNLIPENTNLIDAYDFNGKLINSFGQKDIKVKSKKSNFYETLYFYDGELLTDGRFLYYFNNRFGTLVKYNLDGKIIQKKDLSGLYGDIGKNIVENNNKYRSDWDSVRRRDKNGSIRYASYSFLTDINLFKGKLYLLENYSKKIKSNTLEHFHSLKVIKADDLSFEKEYIVKTWKEPFERIDNFAVTERNNKLIFYTVIYDRSEEWELITLEK